MGLIGAPAEPSEPLGHGSSSSGCLGNTDPGDTDTNRESAEAKERTHRHEETTPDLPLAPLSFQTIFK